MEVLSLRPAAAGRIAASIVFTFSLFSGAGLFAQNNLVQNGGFEANPGFSGWTISGDVAGVEAGVGFPHSGFRSAIFSSETALSVISQNLVTSAGVTYLLSFWITNEGGTPNEFIVQWGGSTVFARTNVILSQWTNVQIMVTANTSSTTLSFAGKDPPGFIYLDDISVTPPGPDTTPPTVTVSVAAGQANPASASPINFTVVFSEPVTGFTNSDVTFGGTAGATTAVVTGSGTTYSVAVSGMTQSGSVTVSIPAGVAQDAAGNGNVASSTGASVSYNAPDTTGPSVTVSAAPGQPNPTSASPINFAVTFSEPVTGFANNDVTLGGTAGANSAVVTGSGANYNVAVSGMTQSGSVTVSVPAGAAQDAAGNLNTASGTASVTYNAADTTPPTVTVAAAAGQGNPTSTSPINFAVTFSEPVTGFANSDVTLGGTAGANSAVVTGSGANYNVAVSGMTQSGTVTVSVPAGAAQDAAGNPNTASGTASVTYNAADTTPPAVTVAAAAGQGNPTSASPINFAVTFSEPVTGFANSDVTVGGTAGANSAVVTGSGASYNVAVSGMTQSGTVTVSVPAGVAQDAAGNANAASPASASVTYNLPATAPPMFQLPGISGGSIQLTWSTVAGRVYQLQFSTDLGQTNWNALGAPRTATGDTLSATDQVGPDAQRFYRVLQQ